MAKVLMYQHLNVYRLPEQLHSDNGKKFVNNWDVWFNASVFVYNTTMSSSTGVIPHYAVFGCETTLPVDWIFPTSSVEKRTMYHWTGDMMEERQCVTRV